MSVGTTNLLIINNLLQQPNLLQRTNLLLRPIATPPLLEFQSLQVDLSSTQWMNAATTPIQIIPAPGVGFRTNIISAIFQGTAGSGYGVNARVNIGPLAAVNASTPEFTVKGGQDSFAATYISLFTNLAAETEGAHGTLPLSLCENQPYSLQTNGLNPGTASVRVIMYYTTEQVF